MIATAVLLLAGTACPGGDDQRRAVPGCGQPPTPLASPTQAGSRYQAFRIRHIGGTFVRDTRSGEVVSLAETTSVSADGSLAATVQEGVTAFVIDATNGAEIPVSVTDSGDYSRQQVSHTTPSLLRASISADGRFVAFAHVASDLVPADTNEASDVFVRDLKARTTERVSVNPAGEEPSREAWITTSAISGDGRFVVYQSSPGGVRVHDRNSGETILETAGSDAIISANGRIVAFTSQAGILIGNLAEGTTTPIPPPGDSPPGANLSLSADGRCLAFISYRDPEIRAVPFVHDLGTGQTREVPVPEAVDPGPGSRRPSLFPDGHAVAFESDEGVFVHDIASRETLLVHDRDQVLPEEPSARCGAVDLLQRVVSPTPGGESVAAVATGREGASGGTVSVYDVARNRDQEVLRSGLVTPGPVRFRDRNVVTFHLSGGPAGYVLCDLDLRDRVVRRVLGGVQIIDFDWSPDGKTLAYLELVDGDPASVALVLATPPGEPFARVGLGDWTGNHGTEDDDENRVMWSPRGDVVLVSATDVKARSMFVFGSDGRRLVTPRDGALARWSPDGRHVYFRERSGMERWFRLAIGSGTTSRLSMTSGTAGLAVSPKGHLAYHETGGRLFLYDVETRRESTLATRYARPFWLSDNGLAAIRVVCRASTASECATIFALDFAERYSMLTVPGGAVGRTELAFAKYLDILL